VGAVVVSIIVYFIQKAIKAHKNALNMGKRSNVYISPVLLRFNDGALAANVQPSRVKAKFDIS
jgi:hypothetical protein